MYNHLQEKKDETCSKEQVTKVQEIIQDKEEYDKASDTVQLCDTVE